MKPVRLRRGEQTCEVRLEAGVAWLDGRRVEMALGTREGGIDTLRVAGEEHGVVAARKGDRIFVWCDGVARTFERARGSRAAASGEHAGDLVSPMPGRVRKTLVEPGQTVARGQILLVLEAMKMEHSIRAPRDGVIARLFVREGDLVDAGVELARIS